MATEIPTEFAEMLRAMVDARFDNLAETLRTTPPEVSIRLNPYKDGKMTEMASATESMVDWWNPAGRYLADRPKFTFDPALHQGRYYVQDASSMIMAPIARHISAAAAAEFEQQPGRERMGRIAIPLLWLDACAAPGGKTTAALDGLPAASLMVANEYDFQRAEILKENLAKWGNPNTVITRGDTSQFRKLKNLFDVISVDAPCSGEGLMRKDATACLQWSPRLVEECATRQRGILGNLWDALRPGGFLVYSTCTFNTTENEEIVKWLIDEFGAIPYEAPILPGDGQESFDGAVKGYGFRALRFIPGRIRGEGLFLAILRKPGTLVPAFTGQTDNPAKGKNKTVKGALTDKGTSGAAMWLAQRDIAGEKYMISSADGKITAFPRGWSHLLPAFSKYLMMISAGLEIAEVKGKDIIPTQQLALSTVLNREAFASQEISREEALAYLSREGVTLPADLPTGFVLLTYGGHPLGFVKNLGNRANNLYPKEWRIKSRNGNP